MIIRLFIRLEVVAFMLDKKGMTLVESLFAFQIYIGILVIFVSFFVILLKHEVKMHNSYNEILIKEEQLSYQKDFFSIIEMVLP